MMKKITLGLFLVACLTYGTASRAQQRYCDLQVTLVSPQENQVIAPYETFDVDIKIKNLGADSILAGDTLLYNLPIFLLTDYHVFPFPQNIAPGAEATFTLQSITNINENPDDESADFCVRIKNNTAVNPQFIDSVSSNNSDCHTVTFGATTGIQNHQNLDELFSIHPNPATNVLYFQWDGAQAKKPESISVRSLDGRLVQEVRINPTQQSVVIPLSKLTSGLYFLDVLTQKGHLVQKFVKL